MRNGAPLLGMNDVDDPWGFRRVTCSCGCGGFGVCTVRKVTNSQSNPIFLMVSYLTTLSVCEIGVHLFYLHTILCICTATSWSKSQAVLAENLIVDANHPPFVPLFNCCCSNLSEHAMPFHVRLELL